MSSIDYLRRHETSDYRSNHRYRRGLAAQQHYVCADLHVSPTYPLMFCAFPVCYWLWLSSHVCCRPGADSRRSGHSDYDAISHHHDSSDHSRRGHGNCRCSGAAPLRSELEAQARSPLFLLRQQPRVCQKRGLYQHAIAAGPVFRRCNDCNKSCQKITNGGITVSSRRLRWQSR